MTDVPHEIEPFPYDSPIVFNDPTPSYVVKLPGAGPMYVVIDGIDDCMVHGLYRSPSGLCPGCVLELSNE